jgi:hypothetical protein
MNKYNGVTEGNSEEGQRKGKTEIKFYPPAYPHLYTLVLSSKRATEDEGG